MASDSVIGPTTVVRGNVRGEGSLEVYGRVEGDIDVTGDVSLGDNAVVRGSITGARLTIGGSVLGDLRGTEAVLLGAGAQVKGDLVASRIGIEEGAQVRGAIRTGQEPSLPAGLASRAESPRREPAERPAPPVRRAPPPPPAAAPAKKRPPEPVVPAMRRNRGKKKKTRRG